jgi:hypothetical protein
MHHPLTLSPLRAPRSRVDLRRSRDVASLIDAQPDCCHINSIQAVGFFWDARYVEGEVLAASGLQMPVAHAWVELSDGTVVDPTPAFHARTACFTYFGAHRWSVSDIHELLGEHQGELEPPVAQYLPDGGLACVSFFDATVALARHLSALREEATGTAHLTANATD